MGAGEISDPENLERCIKRLAVTAEKNVKYLSSRQKEDLYIAGTACLNTENPDSNFFRPERSDFSFNLDDKSLAGFSQPFRSY